MSDFDIFSRLYLDVLHDQSERLKARIRDYDASRRPTADDIADKILQRVGSMPEAIRKVPADDFSALVNRIIDDRVMVDSRLLSQLK